MINIAAFTLYPETFYFSKVVFWNIADFHIFPRITNIVSLTMSDIKQKFQSLQPVLLLILIFHLPSLPSFTFDFTTGLNRVPSIIWKFRLSLPNIDFISHTKLQTYALLKSKD